MKVLVTGGTGFIGSRVVDLLLEHGHSMRLFTRRTELPQRLRGKDAALFPGDLEDPDSLVRALAGTDVLYHVGEIRNTSPRAARRNVRLLEQVIKNLPQAGVKRVVFVSTISAAGIPGAIPATEETAQKLALTDHYTRYKVRCEALLEENRTRLEYAVIRPGVVYGPGSRYLGGLVSTIDRIGPLGIPFVGRGANVAPLVYVQDLARAVYLAGVEPAAAGQVFNVTDGAANSWTDFFQALAAALGRKIRVLAFPPLLLSAPARAFDVLSALFGVTLGMDAYVQYVTADLLFSPEKAFRLLHWKPEYSLSRGAEEMVREYKTRNAR